MGTLLYLSTGVIFSILGGICVFLVLLGLPGSWILLAAAAVIELVDHTWLEPPAQTFRLAVLLTCLAVAAFGEILEFGASAVGAKKGGSQARGMWGAVLGGIAGGLFGILIPILIVGPLLGGALGAFTGALLGQASYEDATWKGSIKPAAGAAVGKIVGTLIKVPLAVMIWIALCADYFF